MLTRIAGQPTFRRAAAVGAGYGIVALLLNIHAWLSGPASQTIAPMGDASQYLWALGWMAHAIAHLVAPWFSPDLNVPIGMNALANPPPVLISALLAPVTWVAGPVAALNVGLLLAPIASGLAMYCAVRRWVQLDAVAILAGLAWAFSPYATFAQESGWLNVATLAVMPMMFTLLAEAIWWQQRSVVRNALGFAVLAVVQLLISTEGLLVMAIVLSALLPVAFAGGVILAPEAVIPRLPKALRTLLLGGLGSIALLALPAWYALRGPGALGQVWPTWLIRLSYQPTLHDYLGPLTVSFRKSLYITFAQQLPAQAAFGAVLLLAGVLAGVTLRRTPAPLLLTCLLICLWLAAGIRTSPNLWTFAADRPVVGSLLPMRFLAPAWFCATFLLALGLNWAGVRMRQARWRPATVAGLVGVLAVVALAQPALAVMRSTPFPATALHESRYLNHHAEDLRGKLLLTYPFAAVNGSAQVQQAKLGLPYRLVASYGPAKDAYRGESAKAVRTIMRASQIAPTALSQGKLDLLRRSVSRWGVQLVVVSPSGGPPGMQYGDGPQRSIVMYTQLLGAPRRIDDSLVWQVRDAIPYRKVLPIPAQLRCAQRQSMWEVARCVLERQAALP